MRTMNVRRWRGQIDQYKFDMYEVAAGGVLVLALRDHTVVRAINSSDYTDFWEEPREQ